MVGENFEIYLYQMAKIVFKLSTMVGENFEIYLPQMAKIAFKLSTMIGENFEIYLFQMDKITFKRTWSTPAALLRFLTTPALKIRVKYLLLRLEIPLLLPYIWFSTPEISAKKAMLCKLASSSNKSYIFHCEILELRKRQQSLEI